MAQAAPKEKTEIKSLVATTNNCLILQPRQPIISKGSTFSKVDDLNTLYNLSWPNLTLNQLNYRLNEFNKPLIKEHSSSEGSEIIFKTYNKYGSPIIEAPKIDNKYNLENLQTSVGFKEQTKYARSNEIKLIDFRIIESSKTKRS